MKKMTLAFLLSGFFVAVVHALPSSLAVSSVVQFSNCPQATTTDVKFCEKFRAAASCHCTSSGLPSGMCQDMNTLYNRMITIFGTQKKACEYQKDSTPQHCMDVWNCYRLGGKDSQGGLCSSTGKAC